MIRILIVIFIASFSCDSEKECKKSIESIQSSILINIDNFEMYDELELENEDIYHTGKVYSSELTYLQDFVMGIETQKANNEFDYCEAYKNLKSGLANSITLLQSSLKGESIIITDKEFICNLFESLTGVMSEFDGTYIGSKDPSSETIKSWKSWLDTF